MASDDVEPPVGQLGDRRIGMKDRRLRLTELSQFARSTLERLLTRAAPNTTRPRLARNQIGGAPRTLRIAVQRPFPVRRLPMDPHGAVAVDPALAGRPLRHSNHSDLTPFEPSSR